MSHCNSEFVKRDDPGVLLIVDSEFSHHDASGLPDFILINKLKSLFFDLLFSLLYLLKHLVTSEEGLYGVNRDGNELLPSDHAIGIVVSESDQSLDVIVSQAIGEGLEGVGELLIGEVTRTIFICIFKHLGQCPLKGADETGRLYVDFLRFPDLLPQILHLHNIEFGNKRIYNLAFLVHSTCVLELST